MSRGLAQLAVLLAVLLAPLSAQAQRAYTVRAGDTLLSIARRHGTSLEAVRRANRLRNDTIRPGQRLTVPGRSSRRATGGRNSGGRNNGVHRVRPGETLLSIARRYGVDVARLRRANRISGNIIRAGARLRIPGRGMGHERPEGSQPIALTEDQQAASQEAQRLGLGTSRVGHRLLTEAPQSAWVAAAGELEVEGVLSPPVDGGVYLRGWGSGAGGYHLAIDIGARTGTPVHAAARGIVAYAGSAIRGYGNVVILVHPNGWVTWYAHNHQNLVVAGQRVERAEIIGHVGSTGYARGPHVHFMLQHGGEHCDALPLLRPGFVGRDGNAIGEGAASWTDARPDEIRCAPKRSRRRARRRRR